MSALVEVHDSSEALATAVAGELLSRLADLQSSDREPTVALTGGTIAEAIHRELARLSPGSGVDWTRVSIWCGDERFVAADSPDRNVGQARAAFLDAVGATQVHSAPASDEVASVDESAEAYARAFGEHGAGFDILMLGIGPDGHVASLFPGHPALGAVGTLAVGVPDSPKPPPGRVTFTFEALAGSDAVWFVASGEGKAEAVARALADEGSISETPARGVVGTTETLWWLDRASASQL